jgi:hypothetical protein
VLESCTDVYLNVWLKGFANIYSLVLLQMDLSQTLTNHPQVHDIVTTWFRLFVSLPRTELRDAFFFSQYHFIHYIVHYHKKNDGNKMHPRLTPVFIAMVSDNLLCCTTWHVFTSYNFLIRLVTCHGIPYLFITSHTLFLFTKSKPDSKSTNKEHAVA